MDPASAQVIDSIFRSVHRPIWIVTATAGGRRSGLVATWVSQTSLDPTRPMLVAGLAPTHYTTELVMASRALAVHLLAPTQVDTAWRFGVGSGRDQDKFAGLIPKTADSGSPILADCLAWLDCRVVTHFDIGDRLYFFADVLAGGCQGQTRPLDEPMLLAAASEDQKRQLKANLNGDIELLRPLGDRWRRRDCRKYETFAGAWPITGRTLS